jgi:hypothetical protein
MYLMEFHCEKTIPLYQQNKTEATHASLKSILKASRGIMVNNNKDLEVLK